MLVRCGIFSDAEILGLRDLCFRERMKRFLPLVALVVLSVRWGGVSGKECTNIPTQRLSHTFRYDLLKSNDETREREMFSHHHLTPTDDSTWSGLQPRRMLKEDEFIWAMMYKKMKNPGSFGATQNFLKEVSLHDVRLDPSSVHGRAQQTNLEYLLMLDVDRLVWSFRKTAGLPTPGKPYGGWEEPSVELRGHFVGHYLSAAARSWASTHNCTLEQKMTAVVSALSACQQKMGNGYLSAFPSEFFDRVEAIQPVWAPYYTIHKIMAGLLDQYLLADNAQALKMVTSMADYFYKRVRNVTAKYSIERHWTSLNEEFGGMNDVLYQIFSVTRDPKHLMLAHLFDKPCFLGLLAVQADNIAGFHANTHIPIVVGSQMRYEITGDHLYKDIGTTFMDIVNTSHSYATGGTSVGEFWSNPKRLASDLETENEESCTTYNMLKVSRHLFRWTKETAYADYYERALTNGVLGLQRRTEPGVMIYMLPLGRGVSKAKSYHGWGTKFDSFWCCYGTGIESFSKLGDSIYFQEDGKVPGLYVIQYISSSLDWKSGKISLTQKVDPVVSWDPYLRVTFKFSSKKGAGVPSTLNLRIPIWTKSRGASVALNGQSLHVPAPGRFLSVNRTWRTGDKLTMKLPITLRTEAIKDDRPEFATLQAILYGPYLLAGHTRGDWDVITSPSLTDWITSVPSSSNAYLVTLSQVTGNSTFVLANSEQLVMMEKLPPYGTDTALRATFRLIATEEPYPKSSSAQDLIGKFIMLEPFDLPGMVITCGAGDNFTTGEYSSDESSSAFQLVPGLDKQLGTVSLELKGRKGCYVHSSADSSIKLSCITETDSDGFKQAASFRMEKGMKSYHPMSFVANGATRSFLLEPLMSFTDEFYTAYFNLTVHGRALRRPVEFLSSM